MRRSLMMLAGVGLVAVGYVAGASGVFAPSHLLAQAEDASETPKPEGEGAKLSEETQMKIQEAATALDAAREALVAEGLYESATKGVNAFAVLSGRCSSLQDLESGRGVDPETFAALYADQGIDEVAQKLSRDPEGRLMYNNKLVRMYPVSRLRTLFAARGTISGSEAAEATESTESDTE